MTKMSLHASGMPSTYGTQHTINKTLWSGYGPVIKVPILHQELSFDKQRCLSFAINKEELCHLKRHKHVKAKYFDKFRDRNPHLVT